LILLSLIPGANIIAAEWVCRATLLPSYYQILPFGHKDYHR